MKTFSRIAGILLLAGMGHSLAAFTYSDADLLLVFRKTGFNDVVFNVGNVSNYLGQANGSSSTITGFDFSRVQSNFAGDLTGVKYVLMAVTSSGDDHLRVWISDGAPSGVPHDETSSRWSTQRGKINAIGSRAVAYPDATNQTLVISPSDPNSYTYIASSGGALDVSTMGGALSFPVEQDLDSGVRFFEIQVSGASTKPFATQAGRLTMATDGTLSFTAGSVPPAITSGPASQGVECGTPVTLSVSVTGDEPLSYQWRLGGVDLSGATASSLPISAVSLGDAGAYTVVVSNAGGSVTNDPAAVLTVTDTTPPALFLPASLTSNRSIVGGAVVIYSASALDACAGAVPVVCSPASGSTFPLGLTSVSCLADDDHGNTNSGSFAVTVQDITIVVTNRVYSAYRTDLTPGSWVYVDGDPTAGSPVRATQRSLGYREVDYKSVLPGTLFFAPVTPGTNGAVVSYDYSAQAAKTNTVGFWVDKDVPMLIGPDGLAYITDGHHTTAGYFSALSPVRQLVPGKNRVFLGHVVANFYDAGAGPQPLTDGWWTARAAENNALLYGPDGDQLTLPGEPNYANLQPILPSVQPMPTTPSALTTNGVTAMTPSVYRSLTWGLPDGIVQSGTDSAGKKIVGYKKSAPGSSVDINFVEFFWADYLRHRIVWDDTLSGSPLGSPNGDASATAAPFSFFTAVANGIALARSEVYRDEYGRSLIDYTNSALFGPNALRWANGSLSNGLAAATDTYNLYLRDDSSVAGDISPSAKSTNILHIDTVSGMVVTQTLQNIKRIVINAGGSLKTTWKDATVSNTTLRLPAGTGIVTVPGSGFVAGTTVLGGGVLDVEGTLGGNLQVTNGTVQGHGIISGALSVASSGVLAPGTSIGTLTVNGSLSLGGTTVMEINKTGASLTSDLVTGISALTYGGTLTLVASGDPLASGDSFKLFDAASYSAAFASLNLPALGAGLAWDSSRLIVDGTLTVGAEAAVAPAIAAQPLTQTVSAGSSVTLVGGAVGTEPMTYLWRFNGNDLPGQVAPTLSFASAQEANQGLYVFVAQNSAGSVTSAPAILTINQAPVAQSQTVTTPWNISANVTLAGSDADNDPLTFVVVAQPAHGALTGSAPNLVYQPVSGYSGPDSFTFKVNDGRLDSAVATVSITVKLDFAYQDTDLLLVFRKAGFNDVLFDLGSVSNFLGQANGTSLSVSNFDFARVQATFGGDLTGVKYALVAVTTSTDPSLRAWLSDSAAGGTPTDETASRWSTQRGKINAVGSRATAYAYPDATNQSVSISPADPNSYTYIASSGGTLDVSTLGGAAPFSVEADLGSGIRLFELKVSGSVIKPAATEVGHFTQAADGSLSFVAGIIPPSIATGPSSQSVECGLPVTFTVSASGEPTLTYQWRLGNADISGATGSSYTIASASSLQAGSYTVVVSNGGGSATSDPALLSVVDTTPPVLSVPANLLVTATSGAGASVGFAATATDTCAASPAVVCLPAPGSLFPLGVTTVSCQADDGNGNTSSNGFTVTVKAGFTYSDTDLLLVFRKAGFNDVLFDLGSISNFLGLANGTTLGVNSFDFSRAQASFGGDLTGVKYALVAVTTSTDASLRVWLSDSAAGGVPTDETASRWSTQRGKINAVGSRAASYFYPASTNQSLSISPSDPNSYTYIASSGGTLDASTLGGATPFPVEQDLGSGMRLFELKVSGAPTKPYAAQVGRFTQGTDGSLSFTAEADLLPVALGDGAATEKNQPLAIPASQLLANDTDPDSDPLAVISVSATSSSGGTVSLGGGTVTYHPPTDFTGLDTFSYTIGDGRGGTATAPVQVFVTDVPLPLAGAVGIRPAGNGFTVRFAGVPGQSYELQRAPAITGPWGTISTVIAPAYGIIDFPDPSPLPDGGFYRTISP